MKSVLQKELKQAKKEMKRCAKQYPDWKDDEYNCGPLKFIWGVVSSEDKYSIEPSFHSMNDIDIHYNRDTKKYLLNIDTMYIFQTTEDSIQYLNKLLDSFYSRCEKELDTKINPFYLEYYANGDLFQADSITELYYKFKIFVKGYSQL